MKMSSPLQLETLVTFMEEYGDLNKPTNNAKGKIETLRRWEELTSLLNSDGTGDSKPVEKWKKVWSDLKNNTKKKAARIHRAASGTGGGPAVYTKLTDLEQRVLNLIGLQVATGLALEEAGLLQDNPTVNIVDTTVAIEYLDNSQLEQNVEIWDQVDQPSTSQIENYTVEGSENMHEPSPEVAVPEVHPARAGQTLAQESPRRSVTSSPRRVARGSPRGLRRRRSPRRLIRPAHTEEAAQHFLNCDREWRQFRMEQHRDDIELRREKNRLREIELEGPLRLYLLNLSHGKLRPSPEQTTLAIPTFAFVLKESVYEILPMNTKLQRFATEILLGFFPLIDLKKYII